MKKYFIFATSVLLISCTKSAPPAPPAETQTQTQPAPEAAAKSDEVSTLNVDIADRACTQDSDCEQVGTQCSCSCGEGVNKSNVAKYKTQLDEMCKEYKGPMCKINCNGSVKCGEKVCTYN